MLGNEVFIFFNLIVKWQIFLLFYHFCHVLKNKQLNKLDFLSSSYKHIIFLLLFPFFETHASPPMNFFSSSSLLYLKITTNDDVELQIFLSHSLANIITRSKAAEKYLFYHLDLIIKYLWANIFFFFCFLELILLLLLMTLE